MNSIFSIIMAIIIALNSMFGFFGQDISENFSELGFDIFDINKSIAALTNQDVISDYETKGIVNEKDDWFFQKIGYYDAAEILGKGNKNIKVAVIDTGIDCFHPALKDSVVLHYDAGTDKEYKHTATCAWDLSTIDTHGTHVAGIIAGGQVDGVNIGIANGVSLYDLKLLNEYGMGDSRNIQRALQKAIDLDVDIINMSLGNYGFDAKTVELVNEAIRKGILVVAASGNEGITIISEPANISGVISVNASDELGIAEFSNYGWSSSITAPGNEIFSAVSAIEEEPEYINENAANGNYARNSGTSMAAPVVTGCAALIKSYMPTLRAEEIKNMLFESASKDGNYEQYIMGAGIVNLHKAALLAKDAKEQLDANAKNIEYLKIDTDDTVYAAENSFINATNMEINDNIQTAKLNYALKNFNQTDENLLQVIDDSGVVLYESTLDMTQVGNLDAVPLTSDENYEYYNITFIHYFDSQTKTGDIRIGYDPYKMYKEFDTDNLNIRLINKSGDKISVEEAKIKILPVIENESETINITKINKNTDNKIKIAIDVKYPLYDLPMEDKNSVALIATDKTGFLGEYAVLWEKDIKNSSLPQGKLELDVTLTKDMIAKLNSDEIVFILARGNFLNNTPKSYDFMSKSYVVE